MGFLSLRAVCTLGGRDLASHLHPRRLEQGLARQPPSVRWRLAAGGTVSAYSGSPCCPCPQVFGPPAQGDAGLDHHPRAAAAAGAAGLRAPQLHGAPGRAAAGRLDHLLPGAEVTAPPRGSPPLPASSLPGRGPATRHHGRLRPAHPAPSGQSPARPARKLRRLGTGRGRYNRFPKPRPFFPAYPITTAPLGWGVVMGPGPPERRLRPAPPLTKLRHFRRVRLASAGRGMAALRSWLSRSAFSFFRYRRGAGVGGRYGGRRALGGTAAPALLACPSLLGPPLSLLRGRPASAGPGSSLTGGFSVIPPAEREPPGLPLSSWGGSACQRVPAAREARAGGGSVPCGQKGPGRRSAPTGPGVGGGD